MRQDKENKRVEEREGEGKKGKDEYRKKKKKATSWVSKLDR